MSAGTPQKRQSFNAFVEELHRGHAEQRSEINAYHRGLASTVGSLAEG